MPTFARSRFDVCRPCGFPPSNPTGAVGRVMTTKCSCASWHPLDSRAPIRRSAASHAQCVVSPVSDSDLSVSGLTCHARLHLPVRRPLASHAPRHSPFHAAFRYPKPDSAAWLNDASNNSLGHPSASFSRLPGEARIANHPTALLGFIPFAGLLPPRRRPRCFHRASSRMPFTRVFLSRPFSSSRSKADSS